MTDITSQPIQWPEPTIKHLPLDPHRVALEVAPHLLRQHPEGLSEGVEGGHRAGVVVSAGDRETQGQSLGLGVPEPLDHLTSMVP